MNDEPTKFIGDSHTKSTIQEGMDGWRDGWMDGWMDGGRGRIGMDGMLIEPHLHHLRLGLHHLRQRYGQARRPIGALQFLDH